MKAILMAAGMGTRISSETNKPKSLLPLGNESLIMHTVKMLLKNDIKVSIILGYKGDCIREELAGLPVTFYENPFYKVTNSIASLWFAREELDAKEDILLGNADVFYPQELLDLLRKDEHDTLLLGDDTRITLGDYFFKYDENRNLIDYGKELKVKDRSCEYVGLAKIGKNFVPTFRQQMESLVKSGEYNYWWENTLYTMIDKEKIYIKDSEGIFWGEVDTKEDYQRILNYIDKK